MSSTVATAATSATNNVNTPNQPLQLYRGIVKQVIFQIFNFN